MLRTFLFAAALLMASPAQAQLQIEAPDVVLRGIAFDVTASAGDSALSAREAQSFTLQAGDETFAPSYDAEAGAVTFSDVTVEGGEALKLRRGGSTIAEASPRSIPGWASILPPLLAIGVALLFRRTVPALFLGVWVGAWIAAGFFTPLGWFYGLMSAFEGYVLAALADSSHASIVLFTLMIGGMVGIISRNGGVQGVVNGIIGWADTPRRGQIATSALGLSIFFDDYANSLIVGSTMRSVTDRLRVSREKLAYVVDSTAAPVSSLALVTTWIGFEVGLIDEAVGKIAGFNMAGYTIFLESILYRFYPLLAIFFVFLVAWMQRDFGPMLKAERRARRTGKVLRDDANVDEAASEGEELAAKEGAPHRMWNAILPVLVLVGGVMVGLYVTGTQAAGADASLQDVIGEADSYRALMWASLAGVLVAAVLSLVQGILTLEETVEAWYAGLKAMLFAMIILVLAWALSDITGVLHTADYLVTVLGAALPPAVVPMIIFVLSAVTAFATGTSWGTMGILMPLVVPLTWRVLQLNGMAQPEQYHILYSAVSCVLAGAVWGDHCSPISDTTILSSMASGCDHIDHVRTQLPYALSVGFVAMLLGTLPAGYGLPWWIGLVAGAAVLVVVLRQFGEPVEEPVEREPEPAETELA
jgi:Na+/H+ antiporter NhaC